MNTDTEIDRLQSDLQRERAIASEAARRALVTLDDRNYWQRRAERAERAERVDQAELAEQDRQSKTPSAECEGDQ